MINVGNGNRNLDLYTGMEDNGNLTKKKRTCISIAHTNLAYFCNSVLYSIVPVCSFLLLRCSVDSGPLFQTSTILKVRYQSINQSVSQSINQSSNQSTHPDSS